MLKVKVIDVQESVINELHMLTDRINSIGFPVMSCEFIHGSIFDEKSDAIVSPANSFGVMDGSLDALIIKHLPEGTQDLVYNLVQKQYHGEIPVGVADSVHLYDLDLGSDWEHLIVAPTMRVPTRLHDEDWNAYLSVRATLLHCLKLNLSSVSFPGMGTGVGGVRPLLFANQFLLAVKQVCTHDPSKIKRGFIENLDWYIEEDNFWKNK